MKLVLLTASVRSFSTSNPSSRTEPDVGSVSPSSIWMVVVLPAPLGPSRAHTWPRGTAKVSPSTAATVPKDFLSSVTSMAGERTRHLLDADNGETEVGGAGGARGQGRDRPPSQRWRIRMQMPAMDQSVARTSMSHPVRKLQ